MEENNVQILKNNKSNAVLYIVIIGIIILFGIGIGYYLHIINKKPADKSINNKIFYYSVENNVNFTPSSLAKKVNNYKELNKNFFVKETINETISKAPVIEVFLGDYDSSKDTIEYYTYGNYTKEDFNSYFSSYIKEGLKCDGNSSVYIGEGSYYKCAEHETGYKYDRIDSEACIITNDSNTICVKPNDWNNVSDYKTKFEKIGWTCTKTDFNEQNYLLCQKEESDINKLHIYIHDDGTIIFGERSICYVGHDLSSCCVNYDE